MNAMERYMVKRHLTSELMKTAILDPRSLAKGMMLGLAGGTAPKAVVGGPAAKSTSKLLKSWAKNVSTSNARRPLGNELRMRSHAPTGLSQKSLAAYPPKKVPGGPLVRVRENF